jgi:hypothetical protein
MEFSSSEEESLATKATSKRPMIVEISSHESEENKDEMDNAETRRKLKEANLKRRKH